MSCWVVPTIAADLWNMPLDQLLGAMISGLVPHQTINGFVFVDVAPTGATIGPACKLPAPPTFIPQADQIIASQDSPADASAPKLDPEDETMSETTPLVTRQELEALCAPPSEDEGPCGFDEPPEMDDDELDPVLALPEYDAAEANNPLAGRSYHQVRRHTARLRVPPPQFSN